MVSNDRVMPLLLRTGLLQQEGDRAAGAAGAAHRDPRVLALVAFAYHRRVRWTSRPAGVNTLACSRSRRWSRSSRRPCSVACAGAAPAVAGAYAGCSPGRSYWAWCPLLPVLLRMAIPPHAGWLQAGPAGAPAWLRPRNRCSGCRLGSADPRRVLVAAGQRRRLRPKASVRHWPLLEGPQLAAAGLPRSLRPPPGYRAWRAGPAKSAAANC